MSATSQHQQRVPPLETFVRRYIERCITHTLGHVIALRSNVHDTLAHNEVAEAEIWDILERMEEVCREFEMYLHDMRPALREFIPRRARASAPSHSSTPST